MSKISKDELEQAFIEMIGRHERIIYKVCSFYRSEQLPVVDLYQETIYNLWKAFPRFRMESKISTWIYRIALNTCISGVRKEGKRSKQVALSGTERWPIEPDTGDNEELRELYRRIHQLRSLERAIVLLYLEERPYQEIADITGLTLSNVAVRLMRAKEKLKQMSNH